MTFALKQAFDTPITLEQALGFSLYMIRAVLSGRGGEVIDLAKTNLMRWRIKAGSPLGRHQPQFPYRRGLRFMRRPRFMARALGRCLIPEDIGVCRRFADFQTSPPLFPREAMKGRCVV